jgi:hypothetical protein
MTRAKLILERKIGMVGEISLSVSIRLNAHKTANNELCTVNVNTGNHC